jgi:class III cytochrome C family protein/cytochrome c7-like protein
MRPRRAPLAAFAAAFVLSGAATAVVSIAGRNGFLRPSARQPIAFNHRKHVKELDIACTTCHQTVETEAFSGLPDAELCASCHSEPQGKSREEARLVALLKKGTPLTWTPLFRQPAHVFYSHRRHVVVAKLECRRCHGAIADSVSPPARVRRLAMDDCLDCHVRSNATRDCTGCHR